MCHAISDKFTDCFTANNHPVQDQNRETSFSIFEDEDDQKHFHKESTLVMDPAKEPVDICWYNMGG